MKNLVILFCILPVLIFTAACSPEPGSAAWCKNLQEKSKGDWTVNEAKDFARHCLFK